MPNKNYQKGVRKERAFVKYYKSLSCVSFRSAGSHSPIDVIAINPRERWIKLIQCKPGTMSKKNREKLLMENLNLNGAFQVSFEVR